MCINSAQEKIICIIEFFIVPLHGHLENNSIE